MKKNKTTLFLTCAVLAGCVIFTACGKSNQAEQTTAAATTAATTAAATAATTAAPETTKAAMTAKLNFDYANLLGDNYDTMTKNFGKPSEEKEQDVSKYLTFNQQGIKIVLYTDDETANYGREDTAWLIETSAGDLFTMSADAKNPDDLFTALGSDVKAVKAKGNDIDGYEFGKSTEDLYKFEMEGYQFEIIPEADGSISRNSRAVIVCQLEAETPETDAEEDSN